MAGDDYYESKDAFDNEHLKYISCISTIFQSVCENYIVMVFHQVVDQNNQKNLVWGTCNHLFLEARRLRQWDSQVVANDKRENLNTK